MSYQQKVNKNNKTQYTPTKIGYISFLVVSISIGVFALIASLESEYTKETGPLGLVALLLLLVIGNGIIVTYVCSVVGFVQNVKNKSLKTPQVLFLLLLVALPVGLLMVYG